MMKLSVASTALAFFVSAAVPVRAENPYPVPCFGEDLETVESDIGKLRIALEDFSDGIEANDFRVQSLLVRWLGAANQDESIEIGEQIARVLAFDRFAAPMCIVAESSEPEEQGVVAFTYQDGTIFYLYPLYFEMDAAGLPSRPGILFHELTHLYLFGGTNSDQDEVYEIDAALELAKDHPEAARANASNWGYMIDEFILGQ